MTVEIAGTIVRRVKRERPDITLAWYDEDGVLIPFTGYTFELSIAVSPSAPELLNKTTGISYVSSSAVRNVRITFTPGELDTLIPGVPYNCQLDATSASAQRGFQDFVLLFTPEHS